MDYGGICVWWFVFVCEWGLVNSVFIGGSLVCGCLVCFVAFVGYWFV